MRRIFRRRPIESGEPPQEIRDRFDQLRSFEGLAPMPNVPLAEAVRDRTTAGFGRGRIEVTPPASAVQEDPFVTGLIRRAKKQAAGRDKTVATLLAKAKENKAEQITDPLDPRLATFWMMAERTANDLNFCEYYDLFVDTIGGPNRNKRV